MGPDDVRARLHEYGVRIRALIAEVERDVHRGPMVTAPVRARLQDFAERLNHDLLVLYERQREPGLSGPEAEILLPAVARLRDLMRGLAALRDGDAALRRLQAAAATTAARS